jgi:pimeloyl-ACP methyl ester carboxylesterase
MDRNITYARAADGVQIAYWTLGEGQPLLYMAGGPWNHIEIWDVPQCRNWYERLAENRMLIRYDVRGTGLSQREVPDISLDGYVADLEAVVGELGFDRFSIFAAGDAAPAAISYAVANPDRVSRLVLWCAYARGADFQTSPRIQAWRGLIDQDWDLMADTCAHIAFGWQEGDIGRLAADGFKANITRETAQIALETTIQTDVTALLPELRVPTLVLHRDAISWLPQEIALTLAANIPDSHLAITQGETTAPYLGDVESLVNVVDAFLRDGTAPAKRPAPSEKKEQAPAAADAAPLSPAQRTAGAVEIIPVYLDGGRIFRYAPDSSDSWCVSFDPARHPGEVAVTELNRLGCAPIVVHSTSWRLQQEELVLTYLAVLPTPFASANGFQSIAVQARDLAVGTPTGAPDEIDIEEVAAHALRHLVWLIERDGPIAEALDERWRAALAAYEPEPFSAFDISGSLSGDDGCLLCTRYSQPLAKFIAESS